MEQFQGILDKTFQILIALLAGSMGAGIVAFFLEKFRFRNRHKEYLFQQKTDAALRVYEAACNLFKAIVKTREEQTTETMREASRLARELNDCQLHNSVYLPDTLIDLLDDFFYASVRVNVQEPPLDISEVSRLFYVALNQIRRLIHQPALDKNALQYVMKMDEKSV